MEQKTLFGHHLGVEGPMKLSAPSIAVLLVLSLSKAVLYGAEQARAVPAPLPIVMWHGMGDSCCASYSLGAVKDFLQEVLDGVYVLSISTGSGGADDTYSGFFGNVNDQVQEACQLLANDTQLQQGYNAIGFSQGGQFLRAVVERCQHTGPKMHTLITMGSQHQGIMNIPECWNPSFNATPAVPWCYAVQKIMGWGAYAPWVRNHIIQAQYTKDPYRMNDYLTYNIFLPDVNNEKAIKSEQYRANLKSLQKLVLFRFEDDVTVVPRDSAWFGFFDGKQLLQMEQTQLYQEDWIGLKALNESNRLVIGQSPGGHMQFSLQWLEQHVIVPYLSQASAIVHQYAL